ncbi:GntR family transcriptional regulator, partial [Sphingobium sp. LMA1-1-1.1]
VLERNELQEHRDLVDACINRDADRAITLLQHHYAQTFEAITNKP